MQTYPCPTPWRIAHPNQHGADNQRLHDYYTYNAHLQPYLCRCGTWHLTHNLTDELPTYLEPTPADVRRLQTLDNTAFRDLVDADVKKTGPHSDRIALRAHELRTRWRWALKALLRTVQTQLDDDGNAEWRTKALTYQEAVRIRLDECRALRMHALDQAA
ncbi:hypothetical protein ACWGUL_01430 [Streptomyces albidoflavus]